MPIYQAPVAEVLFLLNDVFGIQRFANRPAFSDLQPDTLEAILRAGGRLAEDVLLPLNQIGDREGCQWIEGSVVAPAGFKDAYRAYCEGGWLGAGRRPRLWRPGPAQLLGAAVNEFCISANMAFTMYPGLTKSAFSALLAHGSEDQKQLYLPKMISGEWSGTMNLTEPQCGTDLGLLQDQGGAAARRLLRDHRAEDLHLGRRARSDAATSFIWCWRASKARRPAPRASRSSSCPRCWSTTDGSLGRAQRRVLRLASSTRWASTATPTCVMNYDGATGWLVGEANRGLHAMFVMMNEARLGVANQGLACPRSPTRTPPPTRRSACRAARSAGRSSRRARRPDHRASRRATHAARQSAPSTRAPRALLLWTALQADLAQARRRGGGADRPTTCSAC